ncbi:hypothetical protein KA183_04050 [bacterium]|nr:hypothetical protein [bacterium]QQR59985.1 MAG: hypothetical protein IPG59_11035 [Candidatus Melainabacteria bacterium]
MSLPSQIDKIELIDEGLANDLAAYGKRYRERTLKIAIWFVILGSITGGLLSSLIPIKLFVTLILGNLLVGWAYCHYLTIMLEKQFQTRNFNKLSSNLDRAILWSSIFYPITFFELSSCYLLQIKLLLTQGRCVELEALARMAWASHQNEAISVGVPKNSLLANALACSYLGQRRDRQAVTILENMLRVEKQKEIIRVLAVNLALCHIRLKEFDNAAKVLEKHEKSLDKCPDMVQARLDLIHACINTQKEKYDLATEQIKQALVEGKNAKETIEFMAQCQAVLGRIRFGQGRQEEGELHFKTAVDMIRTNASPDFLTLAQILEEHSECLEQNGRNDESEALKAESYHCESLYLERELSKIDSIRSRIAQKNPTLMLTHIINKS